MLVVTPRPSPASDTYTPRRVVTKAATVGRDKLSKDRVRRWWSAPATWCIGGLTVLALGLRWACIHQSLFGDELFLYLDVHGRSLGQVFSAVHDTEKTPPLYFLLGWLLARGSDATVLVRLPSLVASAATVPFIYWVGLRTVGRRAAVVAGAWFAISPFAIFYGTEGRSYALVTALVTLATAALLSALEHRQARWWVLYVLAATGAIYSHYIAALVLIPQAIWALVTHREAIREQLLANATVFVLFLPWLPSFLVQATHSDAEARRLSILAPLTVNNLFGAIGRALVGNPFLGLRGVPGVATIVVLAVALAAGAIIRLNTLRARRSPRRPTLATSLGLLLLLALLPPILVTVYSLQPHTSFLLARNLSVALPYALLLFGWLLVSVRPPFTAVLPLVALGALLIGTVKELGPSAQRPDQLYSARFIDAHAGPNAPVVDVEYPFTGPPADGLRVNLRRPHLFLDWSSAWRAASRTHSPVFVSFPAVPLFTAGLVPPPRYASRYRLVFAHTSQGLRSITIREFAPR